MNEDCDSRRPESTGTDATEPEPDQRIGLDVLVQDGDWPEAVSLEALAKRVSRAVSDAFSDPTDASEAALALSSDNAVRALNKAYRGFDKATNVLSFCAHDEASPCAAGQRRFLGDIILARETLEREAREQGIPLEHHFAHLVAHGLLHLLGYDHEEDSDARIMEALEADILARLDIPNPYLTEKEPVGL